MIVRVVKYNPDWMQEFNAESKALQRQLGGVINHIHHIGSTAVPGLMAKPIIDILLEVNSLTELDHQSYKMESLGYEVMGEFGIKGRRYFRKGGDHRTHQIHAFEAGDPNLIRHLAFRDYLIEHPAVAAEYGALKLKIAERCHNDIEKYGDGKDAFVKYHEAIALEWYKNNHFD